ncbi:unannotated protein [freshwater metagenome]|uniref:Unannotated protein n=1 Tax=freshwater metagenome TaxID=449393 RepID=A0A6J7USB3_9ZZZZ
MEVNANAGISGDLDRMVDEPTGVGVEMGATADKVDADLDGLEER